MAKTKILSTPVTIALLFTLAAGAVVLYGAFSNGTPFAILWFAVVIAACCLAPGIVLLRACGFKTGGAKTFIAAIPVGMAATAAAYYILAALGVRWVIFPLIGAAAVASILILLGEWRASGKKLSIRLTRHRVIFFALCALITLCLIPAIFTSGRHHADGLRFYGYHSMDSIWHLSRIGEISHTVPPREPFEAGSPMRYHVLYHTAFQCIEYVSGTGTLDLYFRLMPWFMSLLFASVLYVSIKQITKKPAVALWAILFFFLAGDMGFLLYAYKSDVAAFTQPLAHGDAEGAVAGANRWLGEIASVRSRSDMYLGISVFQGNHFAYLFWSETTLTAWILLFTGIYFISRAAADSSRWRSLIPAAICIGAMVQAKIQLGVLALGVLGVCAVLAIVFARRAIYLKAWALAALVAAVCVVPWLAAFTYEDPAHLDGGRTISRPMITLTDEYFRSQILRSVAVLPGTTALRNMQNSTAPVMALGWLLFIALMLGGKAIGLPAFLKSLFAPRKETLLFFLALFVLSGLVIGHFTIALGEPSYSSHFVTATGAVCVFAAMGVAWLWSRRKPLFLKLAPTAVLLALVLPMPIMKMVSELPHNNLYARVTPEQSDLYDAAARLAGPDEIFARKFESTFALYREGREEPAATTAGDTFFCAFARRRLATIQEKIFGRKEAEILAEQLAKHPKGRQMVRLFETKDPVEAGEILQKLGIDFIVLRNGENLNFPHGGILRPVYSNGAGTILRVVAENRQIAEAD